MAEDGEFEQFSEAAKLHADYAAVVEQVRQAFLDNINLFLDALRERIGTLVALPVQESREDKKAIRRWWLSEEEDSEYPEHLYIWMKTNATKIVRPGILDVSPWTTARFKPFRHQVVAVKGTLQLPAYCKVVKGVDSSPFTVTISYGEQDPVGEAAGPIAEVLTSLLNVQRAIPQT